jgi:hypothetical protein
MDTAGGPKALRYRPMLDYLRDVAIISACREDRDVYDNAKLMRALKEDLQREGYTPKKSFSRLDGWWHNVYIVPIVKVEADLKLLEDISITFFRDLAGKYGRDRFVYGGILYDAQLNILKRYTHATICVPEFDRQNRLSKKRDKLDKRDTLELCPIERGYYIVLY